MKLQEEQDIHLQKYEQVITNPPKSNESNFRIKFSNFIHVFLRLTQERHLSEVSVFLEKDLYKNTDADSTPPQKTTSFTLTMIARQTMLLYKNTCFNNHKKALNAFLVFLGVSIIKIQEWLSKLEQIFYAKCEKCWKVMTFDPIEKEIVYPIFFKETKYSKGPKMEYFHPGCFINE